jgi:TldD protein
MTGTLHIGEGFLDRLMDRARMLGASYADVRAESHLAVGASAENGTVKSLFRGAGASLGIRALAGGTWGFASTDIASRGELGRRAAECLERAVSAARALSCFEPVALAPIKPARQKITYARRARPSTDDLRELSVRLTTKMKEVPGVVMATSNMSLVGSERHFASTEGANITEEVFHVGGWLFCSASDVSGGAGSAQSVFRPWGARGGWEFVEELRPEETALDLARTASELASKAAAPKTRVTTVVTRPCYNSLLVHEIVGHPCEADRVLGCESAWAGRSWWKQLPGRRVGSKLVNAVSDARPILKHRGCYGTYPYDDEGVPSSRVVHVEDGVLRGFLNSRQSAAMMGERPNGGMRSVSAGLMPLVRMSNTYFEPDPEGPRTLEEMMEDVRDGVLVGHQSIPSIDSRRYRWQINAYDGWEIKNGELAGRLKNLALIGNTREYFGSIYRVGGPATFRLYPIPNCGKGDPMQIQRVTNGGPLMAGRAKVVGGA